MRRSIDRMRRDTGRDSFGGGSRTHATSELLNATLEEEEEGWRLVKDVFSGDSEIVVS